MYSVVSCDDVSHVMAMGACILFSRLELRVSMRKQ